MISEAWSDYAEEFMPSRLANLFFFDGEKIEALADLGNASELLRIGVHSLLGLDIVDQLNHDLGNLISRKTKEHAPDDSLVRLAEDVQKEVAALEDRAKEVFQQRTSVRTRLEQATYRVQKLQNQLLREGGGLFKEKDMIQSTRTDLERQLTVLDATLRELAAESLPLLLVDNFVTRIRKQARVEGAAKQAEVLTEALGERDAALLSFAEKLLEADTLRTLVSFLEADRTSRAATAKANIYLELSEEACGLLRDLPGANDKLRIRVGLALEERKKIVHDLLVVERKLKSIPDEEAIRPLLEELAVLEIQRQSLERELSHLENNDASLGNDLQRKRDELNRHQRQLAEHKINSAEAARITQYSKTSQDVLAVFRRMVVDRHIDSIQKLVLESFRHLIRKQNLLTAVNIDPQTFETRLFGDDGAVISPERLSAGERQLLAVSLLWGLAKASNRALPAVIDTPLGRLDSTHRTHLVERYFPNASHQVLLLSTDEEIRGEYLETLAPAIGHHYLLEFDEQAKTTRITSGYFQKENKHAA
jgi:DNA sulfur modification protein DndD